MPTIRLIIYLTLTTVIIVACASETPLRMNTDDSVSPQWPARPNAARVSYLYSISTPADANIRRSWLGRAWRFVKGAESEIISRPHGIHVDPSGRLYVVDAESARVHVFDTESERYFWFPQNGMEGFEFPIDVAADGFGRVYVSDSSTNQVHAYDDFGETYLTSFGEGELQRPTGLALRPRSNELLVVDTLDSSVVIFDCTDFSMSARTGRNGTQADALHYPTNIAISSNGDTYITDSLNFRIQRLNDGMDFIGHFGAAGDGPGFFARPKGVAVDSDNNIYVVDALFDNIQVFNRSGELLLVFGTSGQAAGEFWLPNDIHIDDMDRIYVSDSYNSRIQVFQYHGRDVQ